MTKPHGQHDLYDYADAINRGESIAPTTDLEATFLHVNCTMQAASMPIADKAQTWENVMTTLSIPHTLPIAAAPLGRANRRIAWGPMATVALAALLVLASIGTWWMMNPPSDDAAPPLAPGLAGLTPGNESLLQVASPEASTGCVTEGSIPIYQTIDVNPTHGAAVWLTWNGDVMYDCGDGNARLLASDVEYVGSAAPNVVQFQSLNHQAKNTDTVYYNLATGKTLVDDGTFSSYLGGPNMYGPLRVLTIDSAHAQWSIVNFRTMESRSLNDITGGEFPSGESISVQVSDDHTAIAIGTSQYQSEGSAILNRQSGLPGEIVVIGDDLTSTNWIQIPQDLEQVNNFALSPRGEYVALISTTRSADPENFTQDSRITVMRVSDGQQVAQTDVFQNTPAPLMQWSPDGQSLVYFSESSMHKLTFDGSGDTVLYQSEGQIQQMPKVGDGMVVHLSETLHPVTVGTPNPVEQNLVIVDIESGDVTTIAGQPWMHGNSSPLAIPRQLAPVMIYTEGGGRQALDPVTGDPLETIVAAAQPESTQSPEGGYFPDQYVYYADRAPISAVVLTNGEIAVVDYSSGSADIRLVPLPADGTSGPVYLSPDGTMLLVGEPFPENAGTYFTYDLTQEQSSWMLGPENTSISFVELSGN